MRRRPSGEGMARLHGLEVVEMPSGPNWDAERFAHQSGWTRVAGVDEAGRGPLAGPVVAGAVVLPAGVELPGIRDSKQLPLAERERLYDLIVNCGADWALGVCSPEEIDSLNILCASHLAMRRALEGLSEPASGALVDGLPVTGLPCPHRALVKGDRRSISIAAAAILAKVTRDRLMVELDKRYPGYDLTGNKGYPTVAHRAALRRLGPSPCHRMSYEPVAAAVRSDISGGSSPSGA